jgi:hypothetical protein
MEMSEEIIGQSGHSEESLYNILSAALSKRRGGWMLIIFCSRSMRAVEGPLATPHKKMEREGGPSEGASGRKTRAHIGVIVWQSKSLRRFTCQEVAEGARFETPTALETMDLDLLLSFRSQSLIKESEAGEKPIKSDGTR